MKPLARRFVGLAIAIVLGQFFYLRIHEGWMSYWLLKDNQQGTAEVTGNDWGGHGRVDYILLIQRVLSVDAWRLVRRRMKWPVVLVEFQFFFGAEGQLGTFGAQV
jgi:hypothetical protein